ncbi:Tar ligand binding domain-containing protein, partial [Paraburkholderia sp. SIMBA_050]
RLLDARVNLSRAGTRMVRGGPKPDDIIRHASASLVEADKAFAALTAAQAAWPDVAVRTHVPAPRQAFYKRFGFRKAY